MMASGILYQNVWVSLTQLESIRYSVLAGHHNVAFSDSVKWVYMANSSTTSTSAPFFTQNLAELERLPRSAGVTCDDVPPAMIANKAGRVVFGCPGPVPSPMNFGSS